MDELFIKKVEDKSMGSKINISPGDTVKVSVKITEAGKERIQVFEGTVIALNGKRASRSITVRKISHGVGVEKIFPLNSPLIKKIEVTEKGRVRRAKLYYMRDRVGKRALDVRLDETFEGEVDDMTKEEKQDLKEDSVVVEKKEKPESKKVKEKTEKPVKEDSSSLKASPKSKSKDKVEKESKSEGKPTKKVAKPKTEQKVKSKAKK